MNPNSKSTKKTSSNAGLRAAMAGLTGKPVADLRRLYEEATGNAPGDLTKDTLIKHLATRATAGTAAAEATTATEKPAEPARAPRATKARDPRLPKVGATLSRTFKGKTYEVVVEHDGFRYAGRLWTSLTAVAKEVTRYPSISGPLFWGIAGEPKAPAEPAAKPAPEPAKAPAKRKAGRPISAKRQG